MPGWRCPTRARTSEPQRTSGGAPSHRHRMRSGRTGAWPERTNQSANPTGAIQPSPQEITTGGHGTIARVCGAACANSWSCQCGRRGRMHCVGFGGSLCLVGASLSLLPNYLGFRVGLEASRWAAPMKKHHEGFPAIRQRGLCIARSLLAFRMLAASVLGYQLAPRRSWNQQQELVQQLLPGPFRWIPWRWVVQTPSDFPLPRPSANGWPRDPGKPSHGPLGASNKFNMSCSALFCTPCEGPSVERAASKSVKCCSLPGVSPKPNVSFVEAMLNVGRICLELLSNSSRIYVGAVSKVCRDDVEWMSK